MILTTVWGRCPRNKDASPDIAIVMPGIEGIEVLMQLRKYRSTAKIIVISGGVRAYAADFLEISKSLGASKVLAKFVSGYAEQAIVRGEFLDAGMNMLTKPFALETLGAKVNSVIRPPSADPD